MSLEIVIVPCLTDNYAYIIHDNSSKKTTLIDAPEYHPIKKKLDDKNWYLNNILITHHHEDHVAGIDALRKDYQPLVFGSKADKGRLPKLDIVLSDRDKFSVSNLIFKCLEVPGHTIGHLAFYCATKKIIFTGDTLMTLGCGRLFEGRPEQMLNSLNLISSLPEDTLVYSGHEYADQNAKFALTIDSGNSKLINRAAEISQNTIKNRPNVPVLLQHEKDTNPFLRSDKIEIQNALGLKGKNSLEIFTILRDMKNNF